MDHFQSTPIHRSRIVTDQICRSRPQPSLGVFHVSATTFAPHWSKLIARAWVDPTFKEQLSADPAAVLGQYGIHQVGSRDVADLAGRIDIVDGPVEGHPKPWMDGDRLAIPLPPAPADYDIVDTAGAGDVAAGAAPSFNGLQVFTGLQRTVTGSSSSQQKNHSVPSLPSISMSTDDDDDGDGDGAGEGGEAGGEAGADAGAEAGAGAGEVAADTAAAGGADAAADAAAAAAALCA